MKGTILNIWPPKTYLWPPPPPILVPYPGERDAQTHIGHKYHLCNLADSGIISLEDMKALVKDPRFICKKCGRAAAMVENLCEPDPLTHSAPKLTSLTRCEEVPVKRHNKRALVNGGRSHGRCPGCSFSIERVCEETAI